DPRPERGRGSGLAAAGAASDVAAEDGFDGSSAGPGCGVGVVEGFFVDGAGLCDDVDGPVDVVVGEGCGDDEGGADDAAGEELAEEEGAVGLGGFAVGVEGGEDEVGGAAADLHVVGDAGVFGGLADSGGEAVAEF